MVNNCMKRPAGFTRHWYLRAVIGASAIIFFSGCGSGGGETQHPPNLPPPTSTHNDVDLTFTSDDGVVLSGTLLTPRDGGPFPAVVMVFGSDCWTRAGFGTFTRNWLDIGIAVFSYDKRGSGLSGGVCPDQITLDEVRDFPVFANDALAAVRALQSVGSIDPAKIGLYGFSEGGWIVPTAASLAPNEIAFTLVASGPAVSTGEDKLYSSLTGVDGGCVPSGLSAEEIDAQMEGEAPSGFDPRRALSEQVQPGLWQYCEGDLNIPPRQSIAVLEGFVASLGKDFVIQRFPNCNHNFIANGEICQTAGAAVDWVTPMLEWLQPQIGLSERQ